MILKDLDEMEGDKIKMIKLKDGRVIIGFDDGYQLSKTANEVFENGVHLMGSTEPTIKENSLFYDGKYYKVGEGRTIISDNKYSDINALILTMAAIARELKLGGMTEADVVFVVGLPFTEYGHSKKKIIEYYSKNPHLEYVYEGVKYSVDISRILCMPQCYSAIAHRLNNMRDDHIIIDVGSKTTDVVYVKKGMPVESKSITLEMAMVKWVRQIQAELQIQLGKDVPEDMIIKVLINESTQLGDMVKYIRRSISECFKNLEKELKERGYNLEYMHVVYVGGGSIVAKNVSEGYRSNVSYACDINANAKGYEYLADNILRKESNDGGKL